MGLVIDCTFNPGVAACKAAGVTGVVRYVSGGGAWKHASRAEVQTYLGAGIAVGLINQHGTDTALQGYSVGHQHAIEGLAAARDVLGLTPRCLYWAVDFDASSAQVAGPIEDYGRGYKDALAGSGCAPGVYGGYRPVDYLVSRGVAVYGWQAAAWSQGQVSPRAALLQQIAQRTLGGGTVDVNQVRLNDWGQYPYAPPPAAPYTGPMVASAESYYRMV